MFLIKSWQKLLQKRKDRYQQVVDPWRFHENNIKYSVCFGLFHVKSLVIVFTVAKTLFILWYMVSRLYENRTEVITLVSCFALSMIMASYAFLIIGVVTKRYTLVIPYFTLCVLLILVLTMKVFVEVMTSANTKTTLDLSFVGRFCVQSFLIVLEIYSVVMVWKVFNYITDYYMEEEFVKSTKMAELQRQLEEELEQDRARRREKAEMTKMLARQPKRKPTFPQIAALLEELRFLHHVQVNDERRASDASLSSSDSK